MHALKHRSQQGSSCGASYVTLAAPLATSARARLGLRHLITPVRGSAGVLYRGGQHAVLNDVILSRDARDTRRRGLAFLFRWDLRQ